MLTCRTPHPPLFHQGQVKQFQPALVSVRDGDKAAQLKELIKGAPRQPEVLVGEEGICAGGPARLCAQGAGMGRGAVGC